MIEQWDILKRCRVFADGFDENYIARGIAEDAHDEIVALRAQVADLLKVAAHERVHNGELRAEFERLTRAGNQYMEEIERLRGIVQADLEEKAEAWGEVERLTGCLTQANAQAERFEREWYLRGDELERLRAAYTEARDMVLNGRGPMEGVGMDGDQTNAVLAVLDDAFRLPSPTEAQRK